MHTISSLDLDLRNSVRIEPIGDRFYPDVSQGPVLAPQWARFRSLLLPGPDLVTVRQAENESGHACSCQGYQPAFDPLL